MATFGYFQAKKPRNFRYGHVNSSKLEERRWMTRRFESVNFLMEVYLLKRSCVIQTRSWWTSVVKKFKRGNCWAGTILRWWSVASIVALPESRETLVVFVSNSMSNGVLTMSYVSVHFDNWYLYTVSLQYYIYLSCKKKKTHCMLTTGRLEITI